MKNGDYRDTIGNHDADCHNNGTHELVQVTMQDGRYVLKAPEGKAFWLNGAYLGNVLYQDNQYLTKYMKIL